jgi:hypothetical protein
MSGGYVAGLGLVVAIFLGVRLVLPSVPLEGLARSVTRTELTIGAVGLLGLVFHCGAMFFPSVVDAVPGTGAAIERINAMGGESVSWYVVSALLVLAALRHQVSIALAVLGLALLAVGITMYDGGSLHVHLLSIFLSVTVLSGVVAFLVRPPRGAGSAGPAIA